MKVAFYVRVSSGRQDLQVQLGELQNFARRRGWEVVATYEDVTSGAGTRRPGLDRLLTDAHSRRFDLLLLWKLDRLGRSLPHMVQVMDDLLGKGIHVVSVTEPHMDSSTGQGRLLRNIFASVAEYERELIKERIRAGLRRARDKGKKLGRRPKVFHRDRIQVLRAEGLSWRQVARTLGISTRTAQRLSQNPQANCATQTSIKATGSPAGRRTSESPD